MDPSYLVILTTLLLSAFFSGLEIAFLSANKLRIELKSNQGIRWAKVCAEYIKTPSKFISTILIGNNIAIVVYGIWMEHILKESWFPSVFQNLDGLASLLLVTFISTGVVLIFAEFLPKALFRINPSGILSILIFPFKAFAFLLSPVVKMTLWLAKNILHLVLKKEFTEESPAFSRIDLDDYITESQKHKHEDDRDVDTEILKNALDFGNVQIRDCMVPRTSIVGIDISSPITDLEEMFIETGHSKILVYRDNVDNIIGYVHHIDMMKRPETIRSILIPIMITNESKPANEMLNDFTRNRKSIAVVVDEFGGTAGIVTTEDIIEEIFGEIEDEHDDNDGIIDTKISDLEYEFSASLEVDYLNEKYNLDIPEGDYETLGGYIISNYESIPEQGEVVVVDSFEFKILSSAENRIEVVHMRVES
ncbi:MAG: HlyC/CorC family transporter [Flavobacteriales bacterium]|nr:HlyC/CorC family transporter [Bacteroidota bacterium]MCB9240028.1 HlyC/CorC family transporter [Flavobacteriales bacterium]